MEIKKKGIFFTIDALIALTIILALLIIAIPVINYQKPTNKLQYDLLSTLSNLKIGEVDNAIIKSWIADGTITNVNKPVLEQIGEFYYTNKTKAIILSQLMIANIPENKNIGLWFGTTLLASKNVTSLEESKNVDVARQKITAIRGEGENVSGHSARAFLSSTSKVKYFYFGGYIGDGNITSPVNYIGNIQSAEIELTANINFSIYVNEVLQGNYNESISEFQPIKYNIPTTNFHSGNNLVSLRGMNGEKLHISGGFIKINFNSTSIYEIENKKYFPGVKGIINIYDGFYIPTELNAIDAYIHYNSSVSLPLVLKIGNTTIFNQTHVGETVLTIPNSEISPLIDYANLNKKTIPLRLFLDAFGTTSSSDADIVLVTDWSGSMKKAINDDTSQGSATIDCNNLALNPDARKTSLAKCLDKTFVNSIFNVTGPRLWPIWIFDDKIESSIVNPSDPTSIITAIDGYTQQGKEKTCLACAINRGYDILNSSTIPSTPKRKFIILMTDGLPTHCADGSCTSNSSIYGTKSCEGYCDFQGGGGSCVYEGCNDNKCSDPINNAIYSANRSKKDQDITIFTIGFGLVGNCNKAGQLLEEIANMTGGKYYHSSNVEELENIYRNISSYILKVTYREQTAIAGSEVSTELYPDSYIQFGINNEPNPYGLILNTEKKFADSTNGNFTIPPNSQILDAKVISYSGPRWTSVVSANNVPIYDLSKYNSDFSTLGDPHSINIPISALNSLGTNNITLTTGVSATNTSLGSEYNKIIYTIIKNISSYNTTIVASAEGCNWDISFFDDTSLTLRIPASYSGSNNCEYSNTGCNTPDCDPNDALQQAAYDLLSILDFDGDGKIDSKITEDNLGAETNAISGIPFLTKLDIQIRTWS